MSTIRVNSIESVTAGSEDYYLARAWVNFNGTGTIAIRDDGNVSSITDNGTGDTTITFSNSIVDANYVTAGTGGGTNRNHILNKENAAVPTTSAVRVRTLIPNVSVNDEAQVNVVVHR
jgi:hypothetical protein